ncbi:MAG: hypothetical protein PUD98_07140 [Bacteroidales bacterium]|nr:hypothetical protein [Bacteroidales bacterium]
MATQQLGSHDTPSKRPACGGVFYARTRWQRSSLALMTRREQRPACGGVFYIIKPAALPL